MLNFLENPSNHYDLGIKCEEILIFQELLEQISNDYYKETAPQDYST